jgi:zinc protease
VIFDEDHRTPIVTTNLWYQVGSKDEAEHRNGFAHLFEHVMFQGSKHVPEDTYFRFLEKAGATSINGTTNTDRTNYFETVPANQLELALWLESDRMAYLLDHADEATFKSQREVVKNERRQSVDNVPYGRAREILSATLYPKGHPYSWDVIGSMSDLSAASVDDVKSFFRLYYAPNNAYLAIVGDFDPALAKGWVKKYFGDLPRGKEITRPTVAQVTLDAERRVVYEDRVQVPRLYVEWPTVGVKQPDDAALRIMGAVLSGSRTARLNKGLIYDQPAAAQVIARQGANEDVGEFAMTITPRPGHSLTELETAADAIVEKLKTEGPTVEELQKATASEELAFLNSIQSNLGKAGRLSSGAGFHGDPGYFKKEYQEALAVTAADVKRVANKYLTKGRVVLSVVPLGKADQAAKPAESRAIRAGAKGANGPSGAEGAGAEGAGAEGAGAEGAGRKR